MTELDAKIERLTQKYLEAPGPGHKNRAAISIIATLWNSLSEQVQRELHWRAFITDDDSLFTGKWPIKELLQRWSVVVNYGGWDQYETAFIEEIDQRRGWRNWHPNANEEAHIRRMMNKVFLGDSRGEDGQ